MNKGQSPLNDDSILWLELLLGEALRKADWKQNRLGSAHRWPAALRIVFGMLYASKLPMLVWWGRIFYNLF